MMRAKDYIITTIALGFVILFLGDWAGYKNPQFGFFFEVTRLGKAWVASIIETDQKVDWGEWQKVDDQQNKKLTP